MGRKRYHLFLLQVLLFICLGCLHTKIHANEIQGIYRAVSLRVLQKRLKTCKSSDTYPDEIKNLTGITRLVGFVKSKSRGDIILIGQVLSGRPSLYLDDFVVALRNAWLKYTSKTGSFIQYTYPGCSIDPDTTSTAQLYKTGQKFTLANTIAEQDKSIREWHAVCQSPQNVKVLGIPYNTCFAKVMVQADYDMKRVVDGSDSLDIKGLISLTGVYVRKAREHFQKNIPVSLKFQMNRFWFYPQEATYHYEKGAVLIKECKIRLLTENEFVDKSGARTGTGKPDPMAKEFTEKFTQYYNKIAEIRPIYRDLENLFRFVAIAKFLKYRFSGSSLNLAYLINEYDLIKADVPKTLPGRSNCADVEFTKETKSGAYWMSLRIPTCGGVSMTMEVSRKSYKKVRKKKEQRITTIVEKTRPKKDTLSWDFKL